MIVLMTDYNILMSAVIKKEMSIIGKELVLRIARKTTDLEIDNLGNIKSGGTKMKLRLLVEEYKRVSGPLAVVFAKRAMKPLLTGNEDIPLELKS